MKVIETEINGKFRKIPVTVTLPEDAAESPFVVMLHGTYSCRHEMYGGYDYLSLKLAEKGIAGVRFDFAGCGDSKASYMDYSMAGALADTTDVIQWSRRRKELDWHKMGMIGWSQGGQLAILKAAEEPEVKSLVLWAPTLTMKDFWLQEKKTARANGYVHIDLGFRAPLDVSGTWFNEAEFNNATAFLPAYSGALLAIAGSEDEFALYKGLQAIMDTCASQDREMWLVEGSNHIFHIDKDNMGEFPCVVERTVTKFVKTLLF